MKLHELPESSKIRVQMDDGTMDEAIFCHIDGMYSYCLTSDGKPFHLSAMTPMVEVDGRWEIGEPSNSTKVHGEVQ